MTNVQMVLTREVFSGHSEWTADGGDLKGKEYLPVKRLHFGDTGTPVDDKRGKYTLGALMCKGDGTSIFKKSGHPRNEFNFCELSS